MEAHKDTKLPQEQPHPDEYFYQISLTPKQFELRTTLPTLAPMEIKEYLEKSDTKPVLQTITSAGTLAAILEELRGSPDLTADKLETFWESTDFFARLPVLMDKSFNLEEVLESLPPHRHKLFWQLPHLLEKLVQLSAREDKNHHDWHTFKLEHIARHIPEDKAEAFLALLPSNLIENEHDLYKILHSLETTQEKMRRLLLKLPRVQNWAYTQKIIAAKKHEDHAKFLSRAAITLCLCIGFAATGFLVEGKIGAWAGLVIGFIATFLALLMANTELVPSSVIAVWTVPEPKEDFKKR